MFTIPTGPGRKWLSFVCVPMVVNCFAGLLGVFRIPRSITTSFWGREPWDLWEIDLLSKWLREAGVLVFFKEGEFFFMKFILCWIELTFLRMLLRLTGLLCVLLGRRSLLLELEVNFLKLMNSFLLSDWECCFECLCLLLFNSLSPSPSPCPSQLSLSLLPSLVNLLRS